jgi:apolipoprotein N-acyltransferase
VPFPPPRRGVSLLLGVLGGLTLEAAFPDLGWWPLAPVAIALLFLALGRDSARWNALVGFLFGLAFFLPHLRWAEYAVGPVPWAALAVAQAGYVALFAAGWSWARRGTSIWRLARWQVPAFTVLWVGVEELRSVWPFGGFPWGRVAFSQADSPVGRWAWGGGVPLVSALVVVVGVCLALAVLALRRLDVGAGPCCSSWRSPSRGSSSRWTAAPRTVGWRWAPSRATSRTAAWTASPRSGRCCRTT